MKKCTILFLCLITVFSLFAQKKNPQISILDITKKIMVVETACGECQFKMTGKSCDLAVRIDGKSYFVEGTTIDEHGDAHAKEGFCNAIRKADVQGTIVNDSFKITYFKLLQSEVSPTKK